MKTQLCTLLAFLLLASCWDSSTSDNNLKEPRFGNEPAAFYLLLKSKYSIGPSAIGEYLIQGGQKSGMDTTVEFAFMPETLSIKMVSSYASPVCDTTKKITMDGVEIFSPNQSSQEEFSFPYSEGDSTHVFTFSWKDTVACSSWSMTVRIKPSDKPGKAIHFGGISYPDLYEPFLNFATGHFFASQFERNSPNIGDSVQSHCILSNAFVAQKLPVQFRSSGPGFLEATVDVDSAVLSQSFPNDTTLQLRCDIVYQTWKIPAVVDTPQYTKPITVHFLKEEYSLRRYSYYGNRFVVADWDPHKIRDVYSMGKTRSGQSIMTKRIGGPQMFFEGIDTTYGFNAEGYNLCSTAFPCADSLQDSMQVVIISKVLYGRENEKDIENLLEIFKVCAGLSEFRCLDEVAIAKMDSILATYIMPSGDGKPGTGFWGKRVPTFWE
jgi:hypothetical protein